MARKHLVTSLMEYPNREDNKKINLMNYAKTC